jgi:hypothetical protein
LREACNHDSLRLDAARVLLLDVLIHRRRRFTNTDVVFLPVGTEARDVVPRTHDETIVDRDRPRRGVRKNEAHRHRCRQPQLLDDRHEVIAIRAEAVQPDHRCVSSRGRLENNAFF